MKPESFPSSPYVGPMRSRRGERVVNRDLTFSEQLSARGADRYVRIGMFFSATPVTDTPANFGLSHPTG